MEMVKTEVLTARRLWICKARLAIPSYQRPYVWQPEDVEKFLQDIENAMKAARPHYFIGTLITTNTAATDAEPPCYELIDGQQRLTTLMLIFLAFVRVIESKEFVRVLESQKPDKGLTLLHGALKKFLYDPTMHDEPRLHFAIREQVRDLFRAWLAGEVEAGSGDAYVKDLSGGLKTAKDFLAGKKGPELCEFGNYLFSKVSWVNNIVPQGTDFNRLFTALNTSGVQLEASDIIKARLLELIPARRRMDYDAIWQACENMNGFFERNLRAVFPHAKWENCSYDELKTFDHKKFYLEGCSPDQTAAMTLSDIVARGGLSGTQDREPEKDDGEDENALTHATSILTFPQLLLHTLRIYRHQQGQKPDKDKDEDNGDIPSITPDRLNECFAGFLKECTTTSAEMGAEKARQFIECLWTVRHQFDQWVMKRVTDPQSGQSIMFRAQIRDTKTGKKRLSRTTPTADGWAGALEQLQTVRYFTGDHSAQYWLTPFLGRLAKGQWKDDRWVADWFPTDTHVLGLLERLDNRLSCVASDKQENGIHTQKAASFDLLSADLSGSGTPIYEAAENVIAALMQNKYPDITHYWFQKLEYILWKKARDGMVPNLSDRDMKDRFRRYRIVSRNSVEHVYPQTPRNLPRLNPKLLHCFGNLALLNPGENSAYGNQNFTDKRNEFFEKGRKTGRYDSLKLAWLFAITKNMEIDNSVGINERMEAMIQEHHEQMRVFFIEYYEAERP
ncbi:DUF262 domain-containing protein [Komagataeibacter sp. FXV3]|uniref:DUF262 domain-containing protein n=1 Tax=Komagataeibacter sp. FXV3 TaxID=2608998 RepID=UPI00187B3F84|nr:DUF262 domain-containing protein [Komagataeibacter sp. FXV3]MBE7728878.1 DUF262 domain-containing protein [Komagataeibacter sp. FXV3]